MHGPALKLPSPFIIVRDGEWRVVMSRRNVAEAKAEAVVDRDSAAILACGLFVGLPVLSICV